MKTGSNIAVFFRYADIYTIRQYSQKVNALLKLTSKTMGEIASDVSEAELYSASIIRRVLEKDTMVTWKVALVVIIIVILLTVIGMWFGYRYVREQDDISPQGWIAPYHNQVRLPMGVGGR